MPFAAPLALLGLAFLPLVVAFWMLKLRRSERTVSSTLLWQRFGEDLQANAPWQRLRRSLLLVLQLLLVVLLALLAAQPFLERPATLARDLVLVIDASASMAATDVAPSRLEAAKALALDALRDLPAGGRVSVVAAGATPRVVANATADLGRVRAALAGITATPATANIGEALTLASALAARAGDAQVLVATDAAFTPPADVRVAAPVTVVRVGRERGNQAIVALAVRGAPTAVTRSVFISVANLDLEPTTERVELWGDGRLLEARNLFLDPVSRADIGIDDVPLDVRIVEVRLAGEDQLALDDRAWAVVPPDRLLRILLVGDGDPYLETALSYLPNAELYGVKPEDYGPGTKPELFDVVIFDAALPAELPRVPTLAIAPPRTSPLGAVTGALEDPALGRPAPDEPLLRYVDLTTLHVAEARRLSLPDWARTVVPTAAGDPLLYTGSRDGIATGVLAFEPRRSDLPLQVAFPILVSNLVGELVGASRAPGTAVAPGSLVNLPVPAGATGLRVTRPDGTTLDLAPSVVGGAAATFASTEQLGIYTVAPLGMAEPSPDASASPLGSGSPAPSGSSSPAASAGASATPDIVDPSAPVQFAVDLFDVGESTIAPGSAAALERLGSAAAGGGAGGAGGERPPARDNLWIPLAAIALAFIALEALVFQRDALVRVRRWLAARLGRGPAGTAPPAGATPPPGSASSRPGRPG
jgi:Ca-activated chloride channel family protein